MDVRLFGEMLNAVIVFTLGLYVFYRNPQNKINLAFFFICLVSAFWNLNAYLMQVSPNYTVAYYWSLAFCIIPLNALTMYVFILVFTENAHKLKSTFSVVYVYITSGVICVLSFISYYCYPNLQYIGSKWEVNIGKTAFSSWVDTITTVWGLTVVVTFYYYVIRFYRTTYDPLKKKQVKYIITALTAVIAFNMVGLFEWMTEIKMPDIFISGIAVEVVIIGFAIIKYDMFAINASTAAEAIISTISDGVFLLSREWRVVLINESALRMLKMSRDQVIGKSINNIFYRANNDNISIEIENDLKTDEVIIDKEAKIIQNQGGIIPISFSGSYIKSSNNTIRGVVCIVRDITDRKLQEKRLKSSNESIKLADRQIRADVAKLKAILTSIGEGMVVIDSMAKISKVNAEAVKLWGWKETELMGQDFFEFFKLVNEKAEVFPLSNKSEKILKAGKPVHYSLSDSLFLVAKDQNRIPISINASPIFLGDEYIGFVVTFENISKEMQIDKAKSEFVSLAAHQLGTPLTAIRWNLELFMTNMDGKLDNENVALIDTSQNTVNNMADLVNQFLNVSRIELNKISVNPVPVELNKLVDDVVAEQKVSYITKHQKLTKEYSDNLPIINLDRSLMRIVVQNLVSNAIKYTPAKGTIKISIVKHREAVEFSVEDSGIGIPLAQQSRLFSKMFRADNARKNNIEGNGLGLYIVKQIVNLTKGDISVESEEGKGTKFTVKIPWKGMTEKTGTQTLIEIK
jgi:PAS domain S-box-containing protein